MKRESPTSSALSVFFQLVLVIPIACLLSIGAFVFHPQYSSESDLLAATTPIIALFSTAYIVVAFLIASRRANLHENIFVLVSLTLGTAYLIAVSGILFLHISYSLMFVSTFVLVSFVWMLWIELHRASKISAFRYLIIPQGRWETISSIIFLDTSVLKNPQDLNTALEPSKKTALAMDARIHFSPEWATVIMEAMSQKMPFVYFDTLFEDVFGYLNLETFMPEDISGLVSGTITDVTKRAVDLIVSIFGLLVISIPIIIVATAIKLETKGSVIFKQIRVGQSGRHFTLYKLRTMSIVDEKSARRGVGVESQVTVVGLWLRRLRIDEWPQFLNVMKGDMSLVGPRPEREPLVSQYNDEIPYYNLRHLVRPGITGWAQIKQGYTFSTEETRRKLQYDLYYIKHFSLLLDLRIIITTIAVVISGQGAR